MPTEKNVDRMEFDADSQRPFHQDDGTIFFDFAVMWILMGCLLIVMAA